MNYYDILLQHQNRIAEAERQHKEARHRRDMQRAQHEETDDTDTETASPVSRILLEVKSALGVYKTKRAEAQDEPALCPQPNVGIHL